MYTHNTVIKKENKKLIICFITNVKKKVYIPPIWLKLVNSPWEEQQDISKFKTFLAQKVAFTVAGTNLRGSALLVVFVKPVFQPEHFPILPAPRQAV